MNSSFSAQARSLAALVVVSMAALFAPMAMAQQPQITVAGADVTEGNSGTKFLTFSVNLSAPSATPVTFTVATSDITATAGSDYVALSAVNQTIPAGQVTKEYNVTINGDTVPEPDETFGITLSNVTGATIPWNGIYGQISNDDGVSGLSIGDVTITEGNSGTKLATFTASIPAAQSTAVTFTAATADGSATAGSDYIAKTTTGLRIPIGSTSKAFTVTINGDTAAESDETFVVNLSNVVGTTVFDGQAVGTISNDDEQPWFTITGVTKPEGNSGTQTYSFTLSLSAPSATAVTYDIATQDSSALAGSDYVARSLAGQSIPAGQTSKTFDVTVNGDTDLEPDEIFFVNVTNIVGAKINIDAAGGIINNDDVAAGPPEISMGDQFMFEGTGVTRIVQLSVAMTHASSTPVTFDVHTVDGTATAGSDYSAVNAVGVTIPPGQTFVNYEVAIVTDNTPEEDEFFTFEVSNVVGATVLDAKSYVTIGNDDVPAQPVLTIGDATVVEGDTGNRLATFTVSLSTSNPPHNGVSFNLATAGGTATSGTDFVAMSVAGSIPAGQYQKDFTVEVKGDSTVEPDETFVVNVSNIVGATAGDVQGVGSIQNDDSAVGPNISVSDAFVVEGNSGDRNIDFLVSVPVPAPQAIGFTLTATPMGASSPSDFNAGSFTGLSIPAGQTSAHVTMPVHGDTAVEGHETLKVQLSAITNANPLRTVGYGKILNDDDIVWASVPNDASSAMPNFDSIVANMSPDGRYIAFESRSDEMADNCLDGECWSNNHYEVYLRDMQTGRNTRVSARPDGSHPNNNSYKPVVSANGRYVVFESWATDMVAGAGQVYRQNLYVRDMQTGIVSRVSVGFDGSLANNDSEGAAISDDGRYVAFTSLASNLVSGSQNLAYGVYVRDLQAGTTQLIADSGSSPGHRPAISADGRYVAFESWLRLVPGDYDHANDVYVFDRNSGSFTLVSAEGFGLATDGSAGGASISADGRRVAFSKGGKIWVRDLDTGTVTKVLRAADGVSEPNTNFNSSARISGDGKRVVFESSSTNLTNDPVLGNDSQIYVRDIATGTTRRVTHEILSRSRNLGARKPMLSGDGSLAVFESDNANMVVDDTGAGYNIFRAPVPAFAAVPTLSIADATVSEGNAGTKQLAFTVSLSAASAGPVGFEVFTFDAGAEDGNDFVAPTPQVYSIPAGQTSTVVNITILGDTWQEGNESFDVKLAHASGASIADGTATGTITNDDATSTGITLSMADSSATEGQVPMGFEVKLSAASPTPVSFDVVTVDASAVSFWPADYNATTLTSVTIPAGQLSKVFTVFVLADSEAEPSEYFVVKLVNVQGATIADAVARGTILDDDSQTNLPSMSIGDVSISEGNSGTKTATFTVSLSAAAASTVGFNAETTNGSAFAGSDFVALPLTGLTIAAGQTSKTFSVTINGDTTVEEDEFFNVILSGATGATIADGAALGMITNDDSGGGGGGPSFSIGDVTVTEGNSLTKTATFTITLSAPQPTATFVDLATADGTATAGSDYVAKSQSALRFAIGVTSKTFAVTINGDTSSESDETFTVNLSNPVGATIADGVGLGTISNDDAAGTPTLSIADASVSEGNSGTKTLTFTVSLSQAAAGAVTYDIATSNGTATAGSDYVASSLVGQSIAAGTTSKTFVVTINGDTSNEADETFNVTLSNVAGATLGDGLAVGMISNDDSGGAGPTLSIGDMSVAEGNSLSKQLTFTVTLSAPASTAVTYNIATADGTAIAPTDYTAKSLTGQSIPAGTTSKTFAVAIKGDRTVEPNETFLVNVTGVTGATLADGQAVGTITNDDAAALTVARFDARGMVDDVDDRNGEPQVAPREYATLLLDTATQLCRRAPETSIVAVEGVENRQVLADIADTVAATCTRAPRYAAVMANGDRRGFLVEVPMVQVLGQPLVDAAVKATTLTVQGTGHAAPLTLVLAATAQGSTRERQLQSAALSSALQLRAQRNADESLVLLGASQSSGLVDLTARQFGASKPLLLPVERVLVSPALLRGDAIIELAPLPAGEAPAQRLRLQ